MHFHRKILIYRIVVYWYVVNYNIIQSYNNTMFVISLDCTVSWCFLNQVTWYVFYNVPWFINLCFWIIVKNNLLFCFLLHSFIKVQRFHIVLNFISDDILMLNICFLLNIRPTLLEPITLCGPWELILCINMQTHGSDKWISLFITSRRYLSPCLNDTYK